MTEKLQGEDRKTAIAALTGTGWKVLDDRDAITKSFKFKNFQEAFAWMTQMALISEKMNHHPEWFNVYNRVEVTLTTHDAGGLSALDAELAAHMDASAG